MTNVRLLTKMKNPVLRLQNYIGTQGLFVRDSVALVGRVFFALPVIVKWPVRKALLKQLYFTGIQSVGPIGVMGFLAGLIMVMQVSNLVGRNELLTLQVLIWTVVRELGPLLTAIVIVGRSSSAIASELAAMRVNGEIKNLQRMGISPVSYLVVPRMVAMTVTGAVLTFYFQVVAIGTGMAVTAWNIDVSLLGEVGHFFEMLSYLELFAALLKSICFGMLVSVVSCYYGLTVKRAMTEIPVAASRAVMRSLLAVFACDGLITVLVF
ncbi:MAG: ABC transporter permease [Gallionellaceae bacterium]|nr:MAG: ABC transporter permease [Gallionellaceae bacterium]